MRDSCNELCGHVESKIYQKHSILAVVSIFI